MTAPAADWQAVRSPAGPTVVWVDGLRFQVPPVPIPDLLDHLSTGYLGQIIPGLLPEPELRQWVQHLHHPGTGFDLDDAAAVATAVAEHITGLPAHTAMAIAQWVTADWLLVDGYHLRTGLDLLELAPRRLFAVLYAFLIEHKFEDRQQADHTLFPPQIRPPTVAEQAQDAHNFMAAMAAVEGAG